MIVCDTGPLLAIINAEDSEHSICVEVIEAENGPLIVPAMIVTEVCYMLGRVSSNLETEFLRTLAGTELRVESHISADYARMADLVTKYSTFPLGAADASVVAIAERLDITRIATLDHRHFRQIAPRHCNAFELFPAEHHLARYQS